MTTPNWTSEIVEAMARALCRKNLRDAAYPEVELEAAVNREWRHYVGDARTALAVALPMILERAAKVADEHNSAMFGHGEVERKFWHLGEDYARKEIAATILALAEPKDNGGEK